MVKADIVSALCEKGYYKNQANDVVDEVLQIIRDALVRGEQVQLRGFGTFEVKTRNGWNIVMTWKQYKQIKELMKDQINEMADFQV